MGSESHGLSADLRAACDAVASIPIHGGAESLNVGVASALMLYAAREAGTSVTKS
jgi:TrmH family RNA methyltransferase